MKKLFFTLLVGIGFLGLVSIDANADVENFADDQIVQSSFSKEIAPEDFTITDEYGNELDKSQVRLFEEVTLTRAMTVEKRYTTHVSNYVGVFYPQMFVTVKRTQSEINSGVLRDWTGYVTITDISSVGTFLGTYYTATYKGTLTSQAR